VLLCLLSCFQSFYVHYCWIFILRWRGISNPTWHRKESSTWYFSLKSHEQQQSLFLQLLHFSVLSEHKIRAFSDICKVTQQNETHNFKHIFWMALVLFSPQKFTRQPCSYAAEKCRDGFSWMWHLVPMVFHEIWVISFYNNGAWIWNRRRMDWYEQLVNKFRNEKL